MYRHSDGYPEQAMPDIESAIEAAVGRWSGPECGLLVSFFLGWHFKRTQRLPDYMMTLGRHGDESYLYYVEWDDEKKKWTARVGSQ